MKRLDGTQGEDEINREVELLSRCHHRNLMPLFAYCLDRSALCLVYPLAVGGSLLDRLILTNDAKSRLALLGCANPSPLPWRLRCRILCEALRGLSYLHGLTPQVLHRDVKPPNVLLDEDGHARLADVGLAKEGSASLQTHMTTRNVSGTPGFMDPLMMNGLQHSPLTDGYAFGITILVTLVAESPWA